LKIIMTVLQIDELSDRYTIIKGRDSNFKIKFELFIKTMMPVLFDVMEEVEFNLENKRFWLMYKGIRYDGFSSIECSSMETLQ